MSRLQRPRREVWPVTISLAKPFLRYSATRDAYVLRVIGNQHGPVLRPKHSGRFDRAADQ